MLKSFNISRLLRIQLKTGYLQEVPLEYEIMRRTPALSRDATPTFDPKEEERHFEDFPYMKYYTNAIRKRPQIHQGVYPAFYRQEPQALTLARKQYELVKNGLSENDAYTKAVDYVENIEREAYVDLKKKIDVLDKLNSKESFFSEPDVADFVAKWKKVFSVIPYEDLELVQQGEIEYFLQTRILKWDEVSRERRMSDPVFYLQFKRLRDTIFPEIEMLKSTPVLKRNMAAQNLQDELTVPADRLKPFSSFYVEDYLAYLKKARELPYLSRWSERDRENLSRWILDTLAAREVLESNNTQRIQAYLDNLRGVFFPMLRFPLSAIEFRIPDVKTVKELLFENEIGYKRNEQGKLYVRRFYLLPRLIYPSDTLASSLLKDPNNVKNLLSEPGALAKCVESSGFENAEAGRVEHRLREHFKRGFGSSSQSSATVDFTSLQALLYDEEEDADSLSLSFQMKKFQEKSKKSESDNSSSENSNQNVDAREENINELLFDMSEEELAALDVYSRDTLLIKGALPGKVPAVGLESNELS